MNEAKGSNPSKKGTEVAFITLHRVKNYGSVLQCYATQYILRKMGYKTEVIDYYPKRNSMRGMLSALAKHFDHKKLGKILTFAARCVILPSYFKRFAVFNSFLKKHIILSKETYKSPQDFAGYKETADLYITGSDQVWNNTWFSEIDKTYSLDFIKNKKKIAFASSFGKETVEGDEKEQLKRLLADYDTILVRENTGVSILEDMGLSGRQVLDPTLVLDEKQWEHLVSDKYKGKKYILVYNINRESGLEKYVDKLRAHTGLPVYRITYQYHDLVKSGRLKCCESVKNFLSLIANAEYVVADSFHMLAFSVNFNKKFMAFYPERFSTRLKSFISFCGLESRVISEESTVEAAMADIDYEKVNGILTTKREESLALLKAALTGENI